MPRGLATLLRWMTQELAKARSDMRTWLMDALDHEQKEISNHGLTHNIANLASMRRALTWAALAPTASPGFHKSEISFNTEGGAPTNMYFTTMKAQWLAC